jgi:dihydrofolate reductase
MKDQGTNRPYTLSLVAVVGPDLELGANNKLLWHISEDLRHFKTLTMGHTVIMGRKTYESLGKPLPGRNNVVLSRTGKSLEEVLSQITDQAEVFVIGGAQIYRQTMGMADKLYLTHVHAPLPDGGADVFFPTIDPLRWKTVMREDFPHGAKFPFPFSFVTYERIRSR